MVRTEVPSLEETQIWESENESVRSRQHLLRYCHLYLTNTMDATVTIWLTSQKNPKSWNVFDNAGRVLSETAVKQCLWKDWSLPGLITSLRDKRSSWSKSWISVCGHISYGVNKEKHTVHHAEKSVQNFYTVVNTAKYHFFKIWPNQKGTTLSKEKHISQTDPSRPTPFHLCLLLISPKLLPNNQWHFCSFNLHYGC